MSVQDMTVEVQLNVLKRLDPAARVLVVVSSWVPMEKLDPSLTDNVSLFRGVSATPTFDQVYAALAQYRATGSEVVVAVGGPDAVSVARGLRLLTHMDAHVPYLFPDVVQAILRHMVLGNLDDCRDYEALKNV